MTGRNGENQNHDWEEWGEGRGLHQGNMTRGASRQANCEEQHEAVGPIETGGLGPTEACLPPARGFIRCGGQRAGCRRLDGRVRWPRILPVLRLFDSANTAPQGGYCG